VSRAPAWLRRARSHWRYRGQERPPFAVEPRGGEESVWDYPRPPAVEPERRTVEIRHGGTGIARSERALRVLETASPPTVYVPRDDVAPGRLQPAAGSSFCEWKGRARYWSVDLGDTRLETVAWEYEAPFAEYAMLRGHLCFYPGRVECRLDGVLVRPQAGGYYGGWCTPEIVGPMKGEPGSEGW